MHTKHTGRRGNDIAPPRVISGGNDVAAPRVIAPWNMPPIAIERVTRLIPGMTRSIAEPRTCAGFLGGTGQTWPIPPERTRAQGESFGRGPHRAEVVDVEAHAVLRRALPTNQRISQPAQRLTRR
jgi:hypothetical protein